ncbi:31783_t:CDS:1, partial [Racocetra persica]
MGSGKKLISNRGLIIRHLGHYRKLYIDALQSIVNVFNQTLLHIGGKTVIMVMLIRYDK